MTKRRKGVLVRFHAPDPALAGHLWVGVDGPNDLSLSLVDNRAGEPVFLGPFTIAPGPAETAAPAYANVLIDFLSGSDALSVSGAEAEEAWRIVTPIVAAWTDGLVPLEEYPAGSDGP
jgi:glucose-6-phosphate 1-dehydrogenase